jgi:RNA polymerase sigma-70 factor, ECF subfamily
LLEAFLGQFDRLKRFVMGMGLSVSDAEDVLQDVSVQVLRHAGGSRPEANPTAWLFAVTVNRVRLDHRRRGKADRGIAEIVEKGLSGRPVEAQRQAIHNEEARIIAEALEQMDDSIRVPMVMRYFCNQDSSQIAEVLDLPASTVRSRLRSGRLLLAQRLLKRGIEP